MKVSPESIVLNINGLNLSKRFFLISGNEETLIYSIEKKIVSHFKKSGYDEIIKTEGVKLNSKTELFNQISLFSSRKIVIHKNPKDVNFVFFEEKEDDKTIIIISHTGLKSSSKLKKEFDKQKNLISINCYQMTKVFKKKIADNFFNQHSIRVEKDGYWYFLDRSPNIYGLFESELKKLISYENKDLGFRDIRLILSGDNKSDDFDLLFFSILSNKNEIIKKTKDVIQSPADAYILLQRIKFYIDLLIITVNFSNIDSSFPRYLFMHKEGFKNIFKKINVKKAAEVLRFLKTTELMLRKNNDLYFLICQRFLLNLNNLAK